MAQESFVDLLRDKQFRRTAFAIGLPVVIAHIFSIGLNMIDTLMIGKLGLAELAGVGAANRFYAVFSVICFGFYSGTSVHLAQFWGVRDIPNVRRILGVDLVFALLFSLLTMALSYFCTPSLLRLFNKDPQVVALGVDYLRIVQFSYILTAISFIITFQSRSIHRLAVATTVNAIALVINTALNYCLIYGRLGFPALGVKGAALATVFARLVEMVALLTYVYGSKDHPFAASLRELFDWNKPLLKGLIQKTIPVVCSEGAWSSGQAASFIAFGKLGYAAQAVVQVGSVVGDFFQAVFFGVGTSCAVMIGNELGRGNKGRAYSLSWAFLVICTALCVIMTLLFLASKNLVIQIYGYDPETSAVLNSTLVVYALFNTPRMLTYVLLLGVLRAGGDTTFSSALDILGVWGISVPLAFLGAIVWRLPLSLVIALSLSDEVVKAGICLWRMKTKRWMNVLTADS